MRSAAAISCAASTSRPACRSACPDQPAGRRPARMVRHVHRPGTCRLHALKYDGELRLVAPLADHGRALATSRRRRRACSCPCRFTPSDGASAASTRPSFWHAAARAGLGLPLVLALQRADTDAAQHQLGRRARAEQRRPRVRGRPGVAPSRSRQMGDRRRRPVTTGATLSGCAASSTRRVPRPCRARLGSRTLTLSERGDSGASISWRRPQSACHRGPPGSANRVAGGAGRRSTCAT